MTDQRHQLSGCHEECDCVNKSEQSENDESGQPIGISAREKFLEDVFVIHPRRYSIYKHVSSRGAETPRDLPNAHAITHVTQSAIQRSACFCEIPRFRSE